jgi:hypothetical protein
MHVDEGDDRHGRPLRRVRWRPAATVVVVVLALTACGSGSDSSTATPNPSTSATIRLQVFKLGARANSPKGTVVVHAYDPSVPANGSVVPAEGMRFVAIDVEGCAGKNADENTGIDPLLFYLQIERDPYYPVDQVVREPALHKTLLAPGRCARGWVTFQIPIGQKPQYAFFRSTARIAWTLPQ